MYRLFPSRVFLESHRNFSNNRDHYILLLFFTSTSLLLHLNLIPLQLKVRWFRFEATAVTSEATVHKLEFQKDTFGETRAAAEPARPPEG